MNYVDWSQQAKHYTMPPLMRSTCCDGWRQTTDCIRHGNYVAWTSDWSTRSHDLPDSKQLASSDHATDIHTYIQTDRQTYTDIQTDRQTDIQTYTNTHRHIHTYRQTVRQTYTDKHAEIVCRKSNKILFWSILHHTAIFFSLLCLSLICS